MKLNDNGSVLYIQRAWVHPEDAVHCVKTPYGFSVAVSNVKHPIVELLLKKDSRYWDIHTKSIINTASDDNIKRYKDCHGLTVFLEAKFERKGNVKPPVNPPAPIVPLPPAPAPIVPLPLAPIQVALGKTNNDKFNFVMALLKLGRNVFMYGSAGTGKTELAKRAVGELKGVYHLLSMSPATTESAIRGLCYPDGYHASAVYTAMKNGEYLIIDEIDRADPSLLTLLNSVIANREFEFPNGEHVKAPSTFQVIATANTNGEGSKAVYNTAQKLDPSTRDRFEFVEILYDLELEKAVAFKHGGAPAVALCEKLQKIRQNAKELGDNLIISFRGIISASQLLANGFNIQDIMDCSIWKGADPVRIEKLSRGVNI